MQFNINAKCIIDIFDGMFIVILARELLENVVRVRKIVVWSAIGRLQYPAGGSTVLWVYCDHRSQSMMSQFTIEANWGNSWRYDTLTSTMLLPSVYWNAPIHIDYNIDDKLHVDDNVNMLL